MSIDSSVDDERALVPRNGEDALMTYDDTADYIAITRLQATYGDAVTRHAWHELTDMFVADCPLRLDLGERGIVEKAGADEIVAMISTSLDRFDFFEFTIVNTVVDISDGGERATGRLYIGELRREADTGRWTTAYGLYRDTYGKVDGRWRFAARDYSSLARTAPDGAGMDVFPIPGR